MWENMFYYYYYGNRVKKKGEKWFSSVLHLLETIIENNLACNLMFLPKLMYLSRR